MYSEFFSILPFNFTYEIVRRPLTPENEEIVECENNRSDREYKEIYIVVYRIIDVLREERPAEYPVVYEEVTDDKRRVEPQRLDDKTNNILPNKAFIALSEFKLN